MLPWLNVATVEFSDLRAEITQHIHSTVWIYQDEQCKSCNGQGFTFTKEQERVPCTNSKCKDGQIPTSPYETIRVRPAGLTMGEIYTRLHRWATYKNKPRLQSCRINV